MKNTVLHSVHEELGARLVEFGGFHMPVLYSGILDEAKAVRGRVGLFDLCHMGRLAITGADAEAFLQRLQTNDAAKIQPGRIRYAMILDEQGRTQDDILVYREPSGDGFFLVVNASNHERDLSIMRQVASEFADVQIDDQTDELAMIALQGPESEAVVAQVTDIDLSGMKYYGWDRGATMGVDSAISRTGYTGENGFEIYLQRDRAVALWNELLLLGESSGLLPCGLGSRDVLRLEAGMPLYGHELDETTTPLDAGQNFAVKFTHDFVGRAALERIVETGGPGRQLIGLETESRRVPRQGYPIYSSDEQIGSVCSGAFSPTLQKNIATAYVPAAVASPGTELAFAVRDKREPARVVALPFYSRTR